MDDTYQITPHMVHQYATTDDARMVVDFLRTRGHSVDADFDCTSSNTDFIRLHPDEYVAILADWEGAIEFAARKNRWGCE